MLRAESCHLIARAASQANSKDVHHLLLLMVQTYNVKSLLLHV